MTTRTIAIVIVLALLAVLPAGASPIVFSGASTWTSWTAADLAGGPFWANTSYDRNGLASIGYYISRTPGSDVPGFMNGSPGAILPFLGTGQTTFAFDITATTDFAHLQSVTGWDDRIGVVNLVTNVQTPLFTAWSTRGTSATLTPGIYAFYLTSGEGYTWTSNTLDNGRNHFALFSGPEAYYLGIEDATWSTRRTADWDYNDFVGRIPNEPVPEPGSTLTMLAVGLAGLAARRRIGK